MCIMHGLSSNLEGEARAEVRANLCQRAVQQVGARRFAVLLWLLLMVRTIVDHIWKVVKTSLL